jgi:hypothetical protein
MLFATAGCLRRTYGCEDDWGPVCCLNKRPTQPAEGVTEGGVAEGGVTEGGLTEGGLPFGVPGI